MSLHVPNAAISHEDALRVYNEDLFGLSPAQLEHEIAMAARIAAHDPGAFIWRGMTHITAQEWADERTLLCRRLLTPSVQIEVKPTVRQPSKSMAWM